MRAVAAPRSNSRHGAGAGGSSSACGRPVERRHAAALGDDLAAVAVHRKGHDRVGKSLAVVIKVEDRVGEGVPQRVVQRLVGVGGVEALLDQAGRQHLGRRPVAGELIRLVGLAPDVVCRRREGEFLVGIDAVGRDDVLAEVLVLVVAPDQHEIRLEGIERGPCPPHPVHQGGPVTAGRGGALIVAPFGAHALGPSLGRSQFGWQIRILQHPPQNPSHAIILPGQCRVVRYSKREKFGHCCLVVDGQWNPAQGPGG